MRQTTSLEGLASFGIEVFSTCPDSRNLGDDYVRRVVDISRWSDRAGCRGMLIYTDNGLVDPWLLAQLVLENTDRLCPLVAVQPVYMHPYSVAKMIASLAFLHGRRIYSQHGRRRIPERPARTRRRHAARRPL